MVGKARCAVRAAFSGAAKTSKPLLEGTRSARYCAGGDIAARCPYHFNINAWIGCARTVPPVDSLLDAPAFNRYVARRISPEVSYG